MTTRARQIRHVEWLKPLLFALLVCVAVAGLSRILLLVWLHDRVAATGGVGYILVQGLRFDLVTLGLLLGIPMALTPLVSRIPRLHRVWFRILYVYLMGVVGLVVLMEASTVPFIMEYDVRPNFLYVEYLKYPKEVFSMLFAGYKPELLWATAIVPAVLWPVHRRLLQQSTNVRRSHPWSAVPLAMLSLLVCVAAVRSTLDHRPVNPSTVAFSNDTLVNSLPLNSLYSVLYAIYELRHEDSGYAYGDVPTQESIDVVRLSMALPASSFTDPAIPTLHVQAATSPVRRPKNLIIVVEESLGAEFVGSLGGLPLTPNLDRFADEGIWFEQLYATGTRSARGLEAIVTGYPPSTSQSVLKLSKAQQGFFTLGQLLGRQGYDTSFIYGGEAHFDNMKRFFANNGFDRVVDKNDYADPVFLGSWGVSDEDTFRHAHAVFSALPASQPFFSVVFTTTNHSPWEFPDGRIELYESPKATVNNAVKYADYALGRFLEAAMASAYWDDTVILVVADHNSRVYGADLVPIERFHIPGLILAADIAPQRWSRIASQIDLLPTLLSLIGVSCSHPAPGLDLTRPDIDQWPGRAIMQYGDIQAYRQGDSVVILRKDKPAHLFGYVDGEWTAGGSDAALIDKARALAAWPVRTYRERRYRLPQLSVAQAAGLRTRPLDDTAYTPVTIRAMPTSRVADRVSPSPGQ